MGVHTFSWTLDSKNSYQNPHYLFYLEGVMLLPFYGNVYCSNFAKLENIYDDKKKYNLKSSAVFFTYILKANTVINGAQYL